MAILLLVLLFFSTTTYTQNQVFDFFGLHLGMSPEESLTAARDSSELIPSEDVLLKQLDPPTPFTLKLQGNKKNASLIDFIYIDFYDQLSYQITIFLNSDYFTFYTLSEKLLDSYGKETSRTSQKVTWMLEDDQFLLTLESPAIIKFSNLDRLNNVTQTLNTYDKIPTQNRIENILEELE